MSADNNAKTNTQGGRAKRRNKKRGRAPRLQRWIRIPLVISFLILIFCNVLFMFYFNVQSYGE